MKSTPELVPVLRDDPTITKDNRLIRSRFQLTTLEHKVLLYLVSIVEETKSRDMISVRLKDIIQFFDVDTSKRTSIHTDLKKCFRGLRKKDVEFNDEMNGVWTLTGFLYKTKIHWKKGLIDVWFDDELYDYLLDLKRNFTTYQIRTVFNFKISHSFRFYEILKSYEYQGKISISVNELKLMLGLQKKYKRYNSFRERVLDPSIKELNEHTDIQIEYHKIHNSKGGVKELVFFIKENTDNLPNDKRIRSKMKKSLGFPKDKFPTLTREIKEKTGLNKDQCIKLSHLWFDNQVLLWKKVEIILNKNDRDEIKDLKSYFWTTLFNEGSQHFLV